MTTPAKKTERTELAWVQLQCHARTAPSEVLGVDFIMSTDSTKLFIGEAAGVPCVIVERGEAKTGRIPFHNVASFGVLE